MTEGARRPLLEAANQSRKSSSPFCVVLLFVPSCSVFALELFSPCFPYAAHQLGCNQLGMSSCLQAKVQNFWSPAPLPEGDAGKDAAAPVNLKEPEAADLEASYDSSVGGELDVEVVGATTPPNPSAPG